MTKPNRARRVLCLLLVVLLAALVLAPPAMAESAAERYARLQEELKETRQRINGYKNDVSAAKELLEELQNEKAIIDEMVALNQEEIVNTETALAQKQAEVAEKRQVIYDNDQLLQQRLQAIYVMNQGTTLSRLLAVDDFSDFFALVDGLRRISQNDTALLELLSSQRQQLENEQAEIDAMLLQLNGYHAELLQNQAALAQNLLDAEANLSEAEAKLRAQKEIEGDTYAAMVQAQKEMQAIANSIGGSSKGDGSEFVGGRLGWPVPASYEVTCEFGQADPNGQGHRGMDIRAPEGSAILACADGTVVLATYAHSSYGNYVVVDHGGGIKTLYAHCSSLAVSVGTAVTKGQTIAAVGSTGFSTGNHLHLEVLDNGVLNNPRNWLQA